PPVDSSDMTMVAPQAAILEPPVAPSPPSPPPPPPQPEPQPEPPPPVKEEKPPEVDEALVNEAKRIARLIISEIKLYNQDKIARAKNKREVLELLKNDLIKGKQHYNSRIASKLPMGPDYFMDTVKEILLAGKN